MDADIEEEEIIPSDHRLITTTIAKRLLNLKGANPWESLGWKFEKFTKTIFQIGKRELGLTCLNPDREDPWILNEEVTALPN